MKVINIFGGPCTGKSTIAAGVFYLMKTKGRNVELVTEYAKDLIWHGALPVFKDHIYIIAKQNRRLNKLKDKVDYAICDSPLLLAAYYSQIHSENKKLAKHLAIGLFETYENINFYLQRNTPYVTLGRIECEEEAKKADNAILNMLPLDTSYIVSSPEEIIHIINKLELGRE